MTEFSLVLSPFLNITGAGGRGGGGGDDGGGGGRGVIEKIEWIPISRGPQSVQSVPETRQGGGGVQTRAQGGACRVRL